MSRPAASVAVSVERFFQFSLLGLVASGYLAVAGSGYLDLPTIALTALGLVMRALLVLGLARLEIPERAASALTLGYTLFFALDYFRLSRDFLQATVHLVFFLAVMKILSARTNRDYLYTAVISFLELLAAALLSINLNFFVCLAAYLAFAMATLMSGEIRRSMQRANVSARVGVRRFHPRLAFLTVSITAGILVLTVGLFFILPRTADAALSRFISHRIRLPGFSTQVTLGEIGEIKITSRPVMHVRMYTLDAPPALKWRGGALADFDGRRWSNPPAEDVPIVLDNGQVRLFDPPVGLPTLTYHVDLAPLETDALFLAGAPWKLEMRGRSVYRTHAGSYRLPQVPAQGFRYDVYSIADVPPERRAPARSGPVLPLAARERFLQLPRTDPRIAVLARQFAEGMPDDLARARAIERRLHVNYRYTLDLPKQESTDPLAHFLFERREGHCEYFASSMAVMLRSIGIPARMVTGFQSGTWNPISELWVIRASDAHTWVEAWIPGYGWSTFDPTPPDPRGRAATLLTKLALFADAADTFWQEWVLSYDMGRQGALADRMEQGARRAGLRWFDGMGRMEIEWKSTSIALLKRFGLPVLAALAAFGLAWFAAPPLLRLLRMRRRVRKVRRGEASVDDATLLYGRMLHLVERRGYHKPAWFTPHEFANSLPAETLRPIVTEFTNAYNALRFGGRSDAASRLSVLLDQLEHQGR
jgi:transglutaminase-like putative cysteine protease